MNPVLRLAISSQIQMHLIRDSTRGSPDSVPIPHSIVQHAGPEFRREDLVRLGAGTHRFDDRVARVLFWFVYSPKAVPGTIDDKPVDEHLTHGPDDNGFGGQN